MVRGYKEMKIAVFHNLPSGGGKRALCGFAKYLVSAGHRVDIFVPSTADETFLPLKRVVGKVTVLPVLRTPMGLVKSSINYILPIGISLADLEETQKKLAALINRGKYQIVLVEQDQYTMSPFILKYLKRPTIYYCQQPRRSNDAILTYLLGNENAGFWDKLWGKYSTPRLDNIDKKNASFAKTILVNSYFSRENVLRAYGKNSFVSYLGVDTEIFRPLGFRKRSYVLSVGRITPEKGFDLVIRALGLVEKKIRPSLVIIGNVAWKSWKGYLEKLAGKEKVKVEIKNLVSDSELVKLYNQAKLFLYAPYVEPFGLAPLEAMSCGTPVVGIREGGLRESIVHGKTGLLTERDEQEFAQAITQLLLDKNMYRSMSREGIREVQRFWTLEQAGERLLNHFNRVRHRK
jgi:glycosyltransferase involved in cell wall biosynthesis